MKMKNKIKSTVNDLDIDSIESSCHPQKLYPILLELSREYKLYKNLHFHPVILTEAVINSKTHTFTKILPFMIDHGKEL